MNIFIIEYNFIYLDIRWGSSLVGTVPVPKHSAQHSVEVSDVNLSAVDFVAAERAVEVAVVELPHSLGAVVFELEIVPVFLNQSVVVDWNSVSHAL